MGPGALTRLSRLGIRPLLLGVLLCTLGLSMYLFGVVMAVPRRLLGASALLPFNEWIVWYSGMPLMAGLLLSAADLFILLSIKRSPLPGVRYDPVSPRVVVALTAYNDELSIAAAVADFRANSLVDEVIVVSNNSQDGTLAAAVGGHGGKRSRGQALVVLCEGDCTFRAYDLDKLIAYAPHADIVNRTRTVERLRARQPKLSTFRYYTNFV